MAHCEVSLTDHGAKPVGSTVLAATRSPRRPRALVCDVDGVVRIWHHSLQAALEDRTGMPRGVIASIAFEPSLLEMVNIGRISDEEWRSAITDRLLPWCASYAEARSVTDRWRSASTLDRRVLRFFAKIRDQFTVLLLTNGTTRTCVELAALGVTKHVDGVVNSADVGVAKPSARIFDLALEMAAVQPSQCLFVDDSARHVAAARELGMPAVVYGGLEQLERALDPPTAKTARGPDRSS
jgi:putative hydrolase of the HAD superfamily